MYCGFLFLPGRGAKRGHRLSPAAFLSCRTGAVPAIPDWASALQTQAWQAAEAYSCHAVAYQREAGECCGSPFLLCRAEGQKHQYRTPWRPGGFLRYQGVERDLHPEVRCGSCCAGPGLGPPDVGVDVARGTFLLCRGSETTGR